jgi:glycosyltransferase involved in cell wall biosynthesis
MKVSVAVCTWNGEKYIEGQIRSILAQERLPDEIVLRDDGSTDRTIEIAASLLADAPLRVDIARNPENLGSSRNFQHALSSCTGDVLFPCDQDDLWKPDKIRRCLEELESSGADLVFHDARLVDVNLRPLGFHWKALSIGKKLLEKFSDAELQLPFLLRQPFVTGCCLAIRREAFRKTVPFGPGWIHDEWMAMALACQGARLHPLAASLVDYRQHPVQQVGVANTRLRTKIRKILAADREAYLKEVAKFQTMEAFAMSKDAPAISLHLLGERILHDRRRADMGLRQPGRWSSLWEEYTSGRYRAYSWWKIAPLKDAARILFSRLAR